MIVDPHGVGHASQHGTQQGGDFSGRHARAKFLGFRSFVGEGLHGEMEHDLVAAPVGFLGNLRGTWMIGEDGEGQGIVQREDRVGGGGIACDIIENNSEARARSRGVSGMRSRMGFGSAIRMEERMDCRLDFAAAGERNRKRCQDEAEDESRDSTESRERKIHEARLGGLLSRSFQ